MKTILLTALCLLVTTASAANKTQPHFNTFFPQMAEQFESFIAPDGVCYDDYQIYLNNQVFNYLNPGRIPDCKSCAIAPVATCLLNNTIALGGQIMQAAAVLLGMLPTILTFIGTNKVETGILGLRRPFLALLISTGAPAVNPLRTFDYKDPGTILHEWPGSKRHRAPTSWYGQTAMIALQYLIVLAAIANIYHVTYQLAYWTVCSFAPETTFFPFLWPLLTILIHIVGAVATSLRVRLSDHDYTQTRGGTTLDALRSKINLLISRELCLSSMQKQEDLSLADESYLFLVLNWVSSTGAVMHMILGTLVFSSIIFISTLDAAVVAIRYAVSTAACRIVLSHELSGMRQVVHVQAEQPEIELLALEAKKLLKRDGSRDGNSAVQAQAVE